MVQRAKWYEWVFGLSHTLSLYVYTPLQADLFGANLQKPLKSAELFADWADFELPHFAEGAAQADTLTPESAGVYMRALRSAGRRTRGWHFGLNPKTRYLTVCLPVWTNDRPRLILGLSILRQVLPTAGDGQPGYILAHRFDEVNGRTLGAILMREGRSCVVGPSDPVTAKLVAHATPLVSKVEGKAKLPEPHIFDELDALSDLRKTA